MTQKNLPQFEVTPCIEGFTLRESLSGQLMHSQVGPQTEAGAVYVDQSDLELRLKNSSEPTSENPLVIYDIGLGIAANAIAVIDRYRELAHARCRPLRIVSFEKYPEALSLATKTQKETPSQFGFLAPYQDAIETLISKGSTQIDSVRWDLITDDFLDCKLEALPAPELIYFDFYSPATCPELWTTAVFKKIFQKSQDAQSTRLVTYAAGKSVRSAMLLAGFFVGQGTSTSMKLETTIAATRVDEISRLLDKDWLKSLGRSEKPFPIDVARHLYAEALKKLKEHPQFLKS